LLERATGYPSWNTHNYYQADGNGNITALEDNSQNLVTGYRYDPFGNTLYAPVVGPGSLNPFRFSSKQLLSPSGMYYYGYRWYDPNLQRWPNRDPINELGFRKLSRVRFGSEKAELNLYAFVRNRPVNRVDTLGLRDWGLLGGKCCNNSSGPEWALVGDGTWKKLKPGECTGAFEDCDGMTCGGGFYQVKNLEGGDCNTPRKDSPKCKDRRWTPSGGGPDSKSPTQRGSKEGDTPPEYPYDER